MEPEPNSGIRRSLRVLMLPWLAYGHISPFLELARRLSRLHHHLPAFPSFTFYICSSPAALDPFRSQVQNNNDEPSLSSIHLIDLHHPSSPDLPPHLHTTRNLPSHLMPDLKRAHDLSLPAFSALLDRLSPDLLIHDFLQQWAPVAASARGVPSVLFLTCAATATACFLHFHTRSPDEPFPFSSLYQSEDVARYRAMLGRVAHGVPDGDRLAQCVGLSSAAFVLVKTFPELEPPGSVDYLARVAGKEVVPIGPLFVQDNPVGAGRRQQMHEGEYRRIMGWLDRQEPTSVAFASFGSEYFPAQDEVREVVRGLELSQMRFVCVMRSAGDDDSAGSAFPLEDDSVKAKDGTTQGLLVRGWAPQVAILAHRSTGAFLTHCGWGSVIEGMRAGLPLVAAPKQLDQPMNARLAAEAGVAVEVDRARGREGGGYPLVYAAEDVARAVRRVLAEEEGERLRRKAREFSRRIKEIGDASVAAAAVKLVELCRCRGEVDVSPSESLSRY